MRYVVKKIPYKIKYGYIGMNPAAALAHHIPWPYSDNTIVVDDKVEEDVMEHSISHECIEYYLMRVKKLDYHSAHREALKHEKNRVRSDEDVERVLGEKMTKFLEYLEANMVAPDEMKIKKQEVLPGTTIGEFSTYDRSGEFSDPKKVGKQKEGVIPQPIQASVTGMPIDRFPEYIQEYEALYMAQLSVPDVDIISHAELLTLYRYSGNSKYLDLTIQRGMVGEPVIAWGPASVEVIDRQGHMIPLPPLKDAFSKFMRNFRMRNGIVLHTDAQVASIIPCYIDKSGQKYASGVNHYGLYILCEIRRDGKIASRVRDEVLKGNIRSFSIAGIATDKHQVVTKSGKMFLQIDALELSEISLVERPANQDANFKLIKDEDHLWTDIMKYLPSEQCDLSDGIVYTDENTIWIRTEPGSLMGEYIKAKLLEKMPEDLRAKVNIRITHDFNEIQKADYRAIYKAALCPLEKFAPLAALAGAVGGEGAAGVATQAAGAAADAMGGDDDDDKVKESLADTLSTANKLKDIMTGDEDESGKGQEAVRKETQLTPASMDLASEKDVDTVRVDINEDGTPRGDKASRGIGRTLGQSGLVGEPNEPVPIVEKSQPSQEHPWSSGAYQVAPIQVHAVKSKGDVDADIAAEEEKKKKEQQESHFEGEEREKTIIRPESGMPFVEETKPEEPKGQDATIPAVASTGFTGSFTT